MKDGLIAQTTYMQDNPVNQGIKDQAEANNDLLERILTGFGQEALVEELRGMFLAKEQE